MGTLKAKAMETEPRNPPHQRIVRSLVLILSGVTRLLKLPKIKIPATRNRMEATMAITIKSRLSKRLVILISLPIKRKTMELTKNARNSQKSLTKSLVRGVIPTKEPKLPRISPTTTTPITPEPWSSSLTK